MFFMSCRKAYFQLVVMKHYIFASKRTSNGCVQNISSWQHEHFRPTWAVLEKLSFRIQQSYYYFVSWCTWCNLTKVIQRDAISKTKQTQWIFFGFGFVFCLLWVSTCSSFIQLKHTQSKVISDSIVITNIVEFKVTEDMNHPTSIESQNETDDFNYFSPTTRQLFHYLLVELSRYELTAPLKWCRQKVLEVYFIS